jgi:hypothetical protein
VFIIVSLHMQEVEEEEEEEEQTERFEVRQKIREALEVGVRRMNLNAAGGAKEPSASRPDLDSRMKKLDRLQSQIEQSFRTVKKELLKGASQGRIVCYLRLFCYTTDIC